MINRWMTLMIHLLKKRKKLILILNHSGLSIQFTPQKIVNQRFFHIIKEITPGILNNTKILLRNHGKLLRQLVCHLLELMHNRKINQSTQLKIVNQKFFHIINVIMHGILNNTKTLLRNLGKLQLLLECH